MLRFHHPEFFIALAVLPVMILLLIFLIRWKKKTTKKIGDPLLVKEMTSQYSPVKFLVKFILFSLAICLCVVALAGLMQPDASQKVKRKGVDIMIALDVSRSMLAQDIKPDRLERAKQVISKVIDQSGDDRIGLVLFAGRAYLQMPLTIDHSAARLYLSGASPDDVPAQGTVIGDALRMSFAAFNPKEKTFKTILLISDGEDHDDEAIKVAKQLSEEGIMINTIGIGSPGGAPIMDEETKQYKTDSKGQTVITKLNEKELQDLAQAGHGLYQLYSSPDDVAVSLRKKIAGMGKEVAVTDSSFGSFKQYFQYFLFGALVLLLLEFFISEKRKKIISHAGLIVMLLFMGQFAFGQMGSSPIVAGNKAYKENRLDDAEKEYRNAVKSGDDKITATYNLGNTLFKKDQLDKAVQSYDETIRSTQDNKVKQMAYYNKGVAYQKAKKLPECIVAYKNALLLNPRDEDARQNLQRALKEEKEKNNKDNKDNKQQQKNKQQDQSQKNQQPKPQPSKISKQDAEEKLRSLMENEKALQDKLRKIKANAPNNPDKDW